MKRLQFAAIACIVAGTVIFGWYYDKNMLALVTCHTHRISYENSFNPKYVGLRMYYAEWSLLVMFTQSCNNFH